MRRLSWLALTALVAVPAVSHAEVLVTGSLGASRTATNTITVTPESGASFSLADVAYEGRAFKAPIYYGYRLSWFGGPTSSLGIEAEFTHAKAYATDTHSAVLTTFQQSHGLNLAFGNVAWRSAPGCAGRCRLVARGGVGLSLPHMESTYRGAHREQYQYGGLAWQVGTGLEWQLTGGLTAVVDARYSRVTEDHLHAAGADVSGTFSTIHATAGVGWRFGR